MVIPAGGTSTQTVTAGASALFAFEVDAIGGSTSSDSIVVTLSCSGVPTGAVCTLPQSTVTVSPGTAAQVSFNVTTTAKSVIVAPQRWYNFRSPMQLLLAVFASLLLVMAAWYWWTRTHSPAFQTRTRRWAAAMALITLLVGTAGLISGCGAGPTVTFPGGTGPTPPGTYNMSVTGTSGKDSHTLVVTLIVQ
jgi:hypothetical protein